MQIARGQKIVVFDKGHKELGEGTFVDQEPLENLNMIAYTCEEHTILARLPHFVRIGTVLTRVDAL